MQKHHRGRSPTSRPDRSFTVKLLCCTAHWEKAAWSRGHRTQWQAAPTMDKASKDQLPNIYASSLPRLLPDFCLHWEMPAMSPCFCCCAQSSQRRVTVLFPSTVTYSSFCFIHCCAPEHFPFRTMNSPSQSRGPPEWGNDEERRERYLSWVLLSLDMLLRCNSRALKARLERRFCEGKGKWLECLPHIVTSWSRNVFLPSFPKRFSENPGFAYSRSLPSSYPPNAL